MTGVEPVAALCGPASATAAEGASCAAQTAAPALSFGDVLARGVESVEHKVSTANELVRSFALDDSVPVHEVTIALEQARLSVEFAMQVRGRVVEAYRDIMNMQL